MKKVTTLEATLDVAPVYDFYKPHARVRYTGELVNHVTGVVFTPPRRVKQSHVAECDINTIMKQYSQTGQLKHISARAQMGEYLDLPDQVDFQASLQIIKDGETAFAGLPAKTRDRFDNDPANFLAFMANPTNQDEAVQLGLMTKPPAPPQATPVASTSESSSPPTPPKN